MKILACLLSLALPWAGWGAKPVVLVEAEQFRSFGGWVLDQQFMDFMGSPYLLAHGLGEPVTDATTEVALPKSGKYRVWVRTKDWVAPWKAPGSPGKFQLLIDNKPLPMTFGTRGADWDWQDGGTVQLPKRFQLALHDLTGFEGRCDAIVFSANTSFRPPNQGEEMTAWRQEVLGLPKRPAEEGPFDLVVTGGGIAGTAAAVSAARLGLSVALIQDRPVLGGNGSSEVRVWPQGNINQEPFPRIGDVVSELLYQGPGKGNAQGAEIYDDARKLAVVRAEPRIRLFLEHRVNKVESEKGTIRAVIAQDVRSGRRVRVTGRWFADCTGDATVGALAGADHEITREGHMGASNLWGVEETKEQQPFPRCECTDTNALSTDVSIAATNAPFPRCPWAVDLTDKPFPGRTRGNGDTQAALKKLGGWYWESGFDADPLADIERMRDLNLRAMYGAWDVLKNVDRLYPNHKLRWAAYIAGKRESRRLLGDLILAEADFRNLTKYEDGAFPCSWPIDLHYPDEKFQSGHEGDEFISRATTSKEYHYAGPYWAPYRCLYSRNINNLFMAGRDISVTHEALGPVRVMRTCGTMGEIVGMAASVCKARECNPRDVYTSHLADLKAVMTKGAGRNTIKP